MYKKTTLIVIFLFVSVSFYPTILTQEITNELSDDLTEITIELCGLKGTQNIAKSISKTQLNNLKEFFESMKNEESFSPSKLKNKIDILKDLDIINTKESTKIKSLFPNRIFKSIQNTNSTIPSKGQYANNSLCLTIGHGCCPVFYNYISSFLLSLLFTIGEKLHLFTEDPNLPPTDFEMLVMIYLLVTLFFFSFKPISILNHGILHLISYFEGWLNTYGLQGIKKCEGWIIGEMHGFTGVKIWVESDGCYILGLSLLVNLKYWETRPY